MAYHNPYVYINIYIYIYLFNWVVEPCIYLWKTRSFFIAHLVFQNEKTLVELKSVVSKIFSNCMIWRFLRGLSGGVQENHEHLPLWSSHASLKVPCFRQHRLHPSYLKRCSSLVGMVSGLAGGTNVEMTSATARPFPWRVEVLVDLVKSTNRLLSPWKWKNRYRWYTPKLIAHDGPCKRYLKLQTWLTILGIYVEFLGEKSLEKNNLLNEPWNTSWFMTGWL